jgi:hypothetical protein
VTVIATSDLVKHSVRFANAIIHKSIPRGQNKAMFFLGKPLEAPSQPCQPSPCGTNALCREQNGIGSCTCLPEYIGNPYQGCRPECTISSDCPAHLACIGSKCQNPCPGSCGTNTNCQVVNNVPVCTCIAGYTGNPYVNCLYQIPESK